MNKSAVHNITDTLGSELICKTLDVGSHSIRHARNVGFFSASWFDGLEMLCREAGIPCPRNAFNWKPVAKNIGTQAEGFKAEAG